MVLFSGHAILSFLCAYVIGNSQTKAYNLANICPLKFLHFIELREKQSLNPQFCINENYCISEKCLLSRTYTYPNLHVSVI